MSYKINLENQGYRAAVMENRRLDQNKRVVTDSVPVDMPMDDKNSSQIRAYNRYVKYIREFSKGTFIRKLRGKMGVGSSNVVKYHEESK
jgi:hypothetical protein